MSYETSDLGYELGYDSEPTAKSKSTPTQIAFPEGGHSTFLMAPPDPPPVIIKPGGTSYAWGPQFSWFGTRGNADKIPDKKPADGSDWKFTPDAVPALSQDGNTGTWFEVQNQPPPKTDDKKEAPKPAADATPPAIEGWSGKVADNKTWTYTYNDPDKKGVSVTVSDIPAGSTADQVKAKTGPVLDAAVKDKATADAAAASKKGHAAKGNLGKVEAAKPTIATPVDKKFGYDYSTEEIPAAGVAGKVFGKGNEKEAGAYMRLHPYPTSKNQHGLPADKLKTKQGEWGTTLTDKGKDLPKLRQEMRQDEVAREVSDAQTLGIPPDVTFARLGEEGKIEPRDPNTYPKEWPGKGAEPIPYKVTGNWDVSKAMKTEDAERVELKKLPEPKKGEGARVEAFKKQTQRLNIFHTWSDKMQKENGWKPEECQAVYDKLDAQVGLSKKEPSEVAGYFFAAPDAKAAPAGKFEYNEEQKKAGLPSKLADAKIDPQSFFAANPPPADPKEREKYYAKLGAIDTNLQQEYRNANATNWLTAYRDSGREVGPAYAEGKKQGIIDDNTPVPSAWPQGEGTGYQPAPIGKFMTPDQVKASQDELAKYKAGVYPGPKLNPDAKAKSPNIGGQAIRFDKPLPAFNADTPFEPLTTSTIAAHKELIRETPEQKLVAGGQPTTKVAGGDAPKMDAPTKVSGDEDVVPTELKGSKWAQVFKKHLGPAMTVVDTIYDGEGKKGPSASDTGALKDESWALPGASATGSSPDPKVEDGLSFERNRMRSIGWGDKEIAEYQETHAGRSLSQIEGTFSPPEGKDSWADVGETDRASALKQGQAEQKEYKIAVDGEAGRMKAMGFTEPEIKEYQRQNGGRTKDQIGKNFPSAYVDGTAIPKEDQDKKLGKTRGEMRTKMIDDDANALMRMDPKLSPKNAHLMAEQMYRERMGKGASEPNAANLDGMIDARKDVENDLHFMSEKPDRMGKLKSRAAAHEANKLYDDVRAKAKEGGKDLEKMFGKDQQGQDNIELFAAAYGVDMTDPEQVAKFREAGISKEKLTQFHEEYAESKKGQPENKKRSELMSKYKSSPSGSDSREKPDFSKLDAKVRPEKEVQWDVTRIQNDWQNIRDEKSHKWDLEKEERQEKREIGKDKRDKAFQLAFAAVQHEMQKDQATNQAMLGLFSNVFGSTANNLQQATLQKLQAMDQLTAQLVLQSQLNAKDIILGMQGRGGGARG